ncbi:hypothetical protein [Nocardia pseudovaccinii]|uniref:hypothetical protein n=1 Tax=Nocardia pseudovaccinii TaxID=189540 RepID=UPI0007A3FB60|nr:hypothetical protein [Nocardia pseudovaccinii]
MITNTEIDSNAAAALSAEAGIAREQAERLVAILREEGAMRSATGAKSVGVTMKAGAPIHVDIAFEDGRYVAGELCMPRWSGVWSNPALPQGKPEAIS